MGSLYPEPDSEQDRSVTASTPMRARL